MNCTPSSAVRKRRPAVEPTNDPLAAIAGLNEVMYHAGKLPATNAATSETPSEIPSTGRLSPSASELLTYEANSVPFSAMATYQAQSCARSMKPKASNRKLKRSERVGAPKTLRILTARSRTGTSAKKKLTKLIRAIRMMSIATLSSE